LSGLLLMWGEKELREPVEASRVQSGGE
jgi:hypothetical protein